MNGSRRGARRERAHRHDRQDRHDRQAATDRAEREAARRAREVTKRAIRRLDMLEWAIFGVGAILAALGGAVVAGLLSTASGWGFRSTWIGASFLLFGVAGAIAVARIKRDERAHALRMAGEREEDDG